MFIYHLIQVGQVFQFLTSNWEKSIIKITVKNGKEVVFDDILIDSIVKVNSVYKYILENWSNNKVQVFYKAP